MSWMSHVKKTMKAHKGMKLGAALKLASKTFKKAKKSKRGGAVMTPSGAGGPGSLTGGPQAGGGDGGVAATAGSVTGGRRGSRKTRKSRGSRKH